MTNALSCVCSREAGTCETCKDQVIHTSGYLAVLGYLCTCPPNDDNGRFTGCLKHNPPPQPKATFVWNGPIDPVTGPYIGGGSLTTSEYQPTRIDKPTFSEWLASKFGVMERDPEHEDTQPAKLWRHDREGFQQLRERIVVDAMLAPNHTTRSTKVSGIAAQYPTNIGSGDSNTSVVRVIDETELSEG